MKSRSILAAMFIALAAGSSFAAASATNLVHNGSFEQNSLAAGKWKIYTGSNLIDWTAGQHGIELRNNVKGVAQDGFKFVELDTTQNSKMSQSISITTPGTYLLSFWYAARPDNGNRNSNTDTIGWSFGGQDGKVLENWKALDAKNWNQFSQSFTFASSDLTASKLKLEFKALGRSDSYGGSIDNVSITNISPVPEPESFVMLLAGLGLMGTIALRRKPSNAA